MICKHNLLSCIASVASPGAGSTPATMGHQGTSTITPPSSGSSTAVQAGQNTVTTGPAGTADPVKPAIAVVANANKPTAAASSAAVTGEVGKQQSQGPAVKKTALSRGVMGRGGGGLIRGGGL